MSHIYRVNLTPTDSTVYVEADTKAQARSLALEHVTVDRLDGGAILALHKSGATVLSAIDPIDAAVAAFTDN